MLGPSTPEPALASAVQRLNPAAVVVWSSLPAGSADVFAALPTQRPAAATFAAGPGWQDLPTPPGVQLLQTLSAAVEAVVEAAVGPAHSS
jgi:hypothetical protein